LPPEEGNELAINKEVAGLNRGELSPTAAGKTITNWIYRAKTPSASRGVPPCDA
jgi:hypothetical protein